MNKSFRLSIVLGMALLSSLAGCGGQKAGEGAAPSDGSNSAPSAAQETDEPAKPEVDEAPLDVENLNTPEGVVNEFFKSFFSGDDAGAFALLTTRAQEAKRDQFTAQESATVRWTITKKMKPVRGRVLVFVAVEDYTESGAIQMDELTFVLTNDDYVWRIAGFSVGELAVNFEGASQETFVQKDVYTPVKTAKTLENATFIR